MRYRFFLLIGGLFIFPTLALAADFQPLVGIPGLTGDAVGNFSSYINALYRLAISVAALIAVVKIIGAGVKYMFSDIVTHKSDAIKDIKGSLLGLLVVISAVLILSTINSDLTNFNIVLTTTPVEPPPPPTHSSARSVEEFCDVSAEGGSTCKTITCGIDGVGPGSAWYEGDLQYFITRMVDAPNDCRTRCRSIRGFFSDGYLINTCTMDANTVDEIITTALETIAEENCPVGGECEAERCDQSTLSVLDGLTLAGRCESQCEDKNGIHFDETTMACVFDSDSYVDMNIDPDILSEGGYIIPMTYPTPNIVITEFLDSDTTDGKIKVRYTDRFGEHDEEVDCEVITPRICS